MFREQTGNILAVDPLRILHQSPHDRFRGDFVQEFFEFKILFRGKGLLCCVSALISRHFANRDKNSSDMKILIRRFQQILSCT